MLITVGKRHIQNGQRRHCLNCPVALALRQATGLLVLVGPRAIEFPSGGRWNLPEAVWRWIRHYDAEGPNFVEPFQFELPWEPTP